MIKKITGVFLALLFSRISYGQQNIILIIADDLGTDFCGFYEDAKDTATMNNIRGLLKNGVRFKNAWASPTCSPTRAGILTGRYPFRTGVGTAITGTTYPDLDTSEITIAKLLKYKAPTKYATANVGKWHISHQTPAKLDNPAKMGYDYYAGNFLGELNNYYNWNKITNGVSTTSTNYATTETVNDAINWLDTLSGTKPFYLWLAFNAPHSPFHLPPANLHTVPGLTGVQSHINKNPKLYFKAMIEAMDNETGRLFKWLKDNGKMDSTTIIFIGDNGNVKKVSQISDTSHSKGTLYEYGVHIPFIISGPKVVSPNRTSDALVNTPDLFATIVELAGFSTWKTAVPTNITVDSKSLMPLIKNQNTVVRDWAFTEQFTPVADPNDGKAIRNKDYKLIALDNGKQEFYKVSTDLNEQTDLLKGTLTNAELTEYNYLCNQLGTLLGKNMCLSLGNINLKERKNKIYFYPNPVEDRLYLKNLPEMDFKIEVLDAAGRKLLFFNNSSVLDVSALNHGIYFLRIAASGSVYDFRFIK